MNLDDAAIHELLQRTALRSSFALFLQLLQRQYPDIGNIQSADPILEGYEAANFKLTTDKGQYVLKIFEANRQKENIDSLIKILIEAPKAGVPVPVLVRGINGNLSIFNEGDIDIFYYLTEFFSGKNFEYRIPTVEEMRIITGYLSKLNSLNFPVVEAYDSWGNKNVVKEFRENKIALLQPELQLIEPIINKMRKINLQSFSKGVIHGDMQKKHVLKSTGGDYCILDFGCMSNDAKVLDLSTYLAWFCLSKETKKQWGALQQMVLEEYTKKNPLTKSEIRALPVLIRASYAAYFMKTSILMRRGDESKETKQWNINAKEMILSF